MDGLWMVDGWMVRRSLHSPCPECRLYDLTNFSKNKKNWSFLPEVPQPELMLTTTRGRATVAGLDSSQEYNLQVLLLNGTTEKLLAKRRFTRKKHIKVVGRNLLVAKTRLKKKKRREGPIFTNHTLPGHIYL